jgi:DNA-directed RNA polymerase subunit RPC12/RpoP
MTREEAVIILDGFKSNPLFSDTHAQALDMAISALSENKGEWIKIYPDQEEWNVYECSHCGEAFDLIEGTPYDNGYNFCPNCGADMRAESEGI